MGAFALIIGPDKPQANEHETREIKVRAALEKRGFTTTRRLVVGPNILLIAPSMITPEPGFVSRGDDFAASCGTLFYRGLYGEAALGAILDLDGLPARDDISGCGVFMVARGGGLRIIPDPLGTYKLYRDADDRIWSDSFLAVAAIQSAPSINTQGVYEYVFEGAVHGHETVIETIRRLDSHAIHDVGDKITNIPWGGRIEPVRDTLSLEDNVEALNSLLRDRFHAIGKAFGARVDTALSGGYDSRLTLALLLDQGITPKLHVYGRDTDPDVVVAKTVCAGEGLAISHENKENHGEQDPGSVAAMVERQFHAFDGWPPDGIIGNGNDLSSRRSRCRGGRLALNGGGGEIFRNFFYLPDQSFTLRQIMWTFYSQFEPRWCTALFDEHAYHETLAGQADNIFTTPRKRLTRAEVEFIYPAFRGRFWTGRNTSINTHLGPALTPFLDHAIVRHAVRVPLTQKNHGILEAAMIRSLNPRLASYTSDYGHDFGGVVPLRRRLKDWATYMRPPALRRLTYRTRARALPPQLAPIQNGPFREAYLPEGIHYMNRYFNIYPSPLSVRDPAHMNRILTLEILFQKLNAQG